MSVRQSTISIAAALATALATGLVAHAECPVQWSPILSQANGNSGSVYRIRWYDPDGAGPLSRKMLLYGRLMGLQVSPTAGSLVLYDPATGAWSTLGQPSFPASISNVEILPNNELLVAGQFNSIGGVNANNITIWNGSAWRSLGAGTNGPVYTTATMPNGDIIAAGQFTSAGGVSANYIARWNGANWSPLSTGLNSNAVYALLPEPSGSVLVGGGFSTAGGLPIRTVARWDSNTWSPVGANTVSGSVYTFTVTPAGQVLASGLLAAGSPLEWRVVAALNNDAWQPVTSSPSNADPAIFGLAVLPNGNLLAGGRFTSIGSAPASGIALWNGSAWSPFGPGDGNREIGDFLMTDSGTLYVAGVERPAPNAQPFTYFARTTHACIADCDCSAALSPADFSCFLANYRSGSTSADCDGSQSLTPADFTCFLAKYRAGCI